MLKYRIKMTVEVYLKADFEKVGYGSIEAMVSTLICDALAEFNKARGTTPDRNLREAAEVYVQKKRVLLEEDPYTAAELRERIDKAVERALVAEQIRNAVASGSKMNLELFPENCEDCDLPLGKDGLEQEREVREKAEVKAFEKEKRAAQDEAGRLTEHNELLRERAEKAEAALAKMREALQWALDEKMANRQICDLHKTSRLECPCWQCKARAALTETTKPEE